MNKKVKRMIFITLAVTFVSGAVLLPTTATVFAAEQINQEQPAPPAGDAPKDGGNEHSGHHM